MAFTRAQFRVHSSVKDGTTLDIKKEGEDEWTACFKLEGAKLSNSLFTVYSSFSGAGKANRHVLHSIKFHDLETAIKPDFDTKHEAFKGSATDLLHSGNLKDTAIAQNRDLALSAYNRELTRHNSVSAKLYTHYESNVQTLNGIINAFPDEPFYAKLMQDIQMFQTLQLGFTGHTHKIVEAVSDAVALTQVTEQQNQAIPIIMSAETQNVFIPTLDQLDAVA